MAVDDGAPASVRDEIERAGTATGRWHAEYLGLAYRLAVEKALHLNGRAGPTILKTDLWNECLGGSRDILGHLRESGAARFVGVDISYAVCAGGRARVPGVHVVQADIAALPFRAATFDGVLDLSTLDHVSGAGVAGAVGEYGRVLRDGGVLLLVFWQRNVSIRLRLALKRWLGRSEKADQSYLARAEVEDALGGRLAVVEEFVVGLLFLPPQSFTGRLLGRLSADALDRFLGWLVRIERSALLRPLARHVAGLYGLTALRRRS